MFDDVAAVLLAEARKKQLRSLDDVERKVNQLREAFGGPWRAITTARVNAYQADCAARGNRVDDGVPGSQPPRRRGQG